MTPLYPPVAGGDRPQFITPPHTHDASMWDSHDEPLSRSYLADRSNAQPDFPQMLQTPWESQQIVDLIKEVDSLKHELASLRQKIEGKGHKQKLKLPPELSVSSIIM